MLVYWWESRDWTCSDPPVHPRHLKEGPCQELSWHSNKLPAFEAVCFKRCSLFSAWLRVTIYQITTSLWVSPTRLKSLRWGPQFISLPLQLLAQSWVCMNQTLTIHGCLLGTYYRPNGVFSAGNRSWRTNKNPCSQGAYILVWQTKQNVSDKGISVTGENTVGDEGGECWWEVGAHIALSSSLESIWAKTVLGCEQWNYLEESCWGS